jgi:hypothetical protein
VEEVSLIRFDPRPGFAGKVVLPVLAPGGRGVDIPLFGFGMPAFFNLPMNCHEEPPAKSDGKKSSLFALFVYPGPGAREKK